MLNIHDVQAEKACDSTADCGYESMQSQNSNISSLKTSVIETSQQTRNMKLRECSPLPKSVLSPVEFCESYRRMLNNLKSAQNNPT